MQLVSGSRLHLKKKMDFRLSSVNSMWIIYEEYEKGDILYQW